MTRILLPLVALALALPTATHAQGNDKAYCAQLIDLYRRYVQNAGGRRIDVEALTAIDDCQKGNTAAGIPVLAKRLRDSGFTVPGEFKP